MVRTVAKCTIINQYMDQAANSWFFEGRWGIYSSWLGNEVHSDEVPVKASRVVCPEGDQVACE